MADTRERTQSTPAQILQQAAAAYAGGKWVEAARLCGLVLREQADHFDALNMVGVIAIRIRRPDDAAYHLARAVASRPNDATARNNYGIALAHLGRFGDALDSYQRALEITPDYAEAYNGCGTALHALRRFDEALAIELASNPGRLAELKDRLAENRLTTPLFDTGLFTQHIEDAYTQMYERYQADLDPDHIPIY